MVFFEFSSFAAVDVDIEVDIDVDGDRREVPGTRFVLPTTKANSRIMFMRFPKTDDRVPYTWCNRKVIPVIEFAVLCLVRPSEE